MDMLWIIVIVIAGSGLLGGIVNFFIADPETEKPLTWWKHIFIGFVAAGMVPLFLNMISSGLIDSILGRSNQSPDPSKLFVLAGFCLVASISARAFIRTISERVLQEARSAKKKAEDAQEQAIKAMAIVAPLVEEETPKDVAATAPEGEGALEVALSDDERSILTAMIRSSFIMRSVSGLAKDTGLEKARVNELLSSLIAKGLVAQGLGSGGNPRWYATTAGRTRLTY
jgi:hypothetical protein